MSLVFLISLSRRSTEDCEGQMESPNEELSSNVAGAWMRILRLGG